MSTKKDYKPTAIRMYNDMVNDFTQLCNIYDIDKHCIVMIPDLMALGYCKVQDVDDVDMITIISQVIREDDEQQLKQPHKPTYGFMAYQDIATKITNVLIAAGYVRMKELSDDK